MSGERGPVLVVEPNMEGHRFNYVRILVEECRARGRDVTVLTTPAVRADYLRKAEATPPAWELVADGTRPTPAELAAVSRRVAAATVVVPDGDSTALALARRPRWPGSGELRILIMRAHAQAGRHPRLAPLRTWIRRAGFAVADAVPRVTLLTLGSALSVGEPGRRRVADPIEFAPTDEARRTLRQAVDHDRFWFVIAGWLDARKNVPLVLAALAEAARQTQRPLGLLLAGRQAPELAAELNGIDRGDVLVTALDRHLTAAELDAAIEVADCAVLAHSNEGPSGILGKAAAARTRVIAAGARTLAEDCRRLGPSAQWVELDPQALTAAAVRAVAQPPTGDVRVAGPADFAEALLGPR